MVGSVHSFEWADLFAKVSGFLKSQQVDRDGKTIPVDIGLHVQKGELLAEIDDPEIYAEADKAAADVEQARAQAAQAVAALETAKANLEAEKAAVKEAEADVGRYVAHRQETSKAYERYKGLRTMSAVEQDVVDQKEDAYESAIAAEGSAKADVITANAKVVAATAKVAQAAADLKASQANIKVAEATLKKAQALVDYTKIRSPYTGVVTERKFHVGDFIRSAAEGGTTSLLTVARTDLMRVETKIPDLDVPYANVGDPAVVRLNALEGLELHGVISRISEAEEPTERMMRAEIDLPNDANSPAHGRLREGMYGETIITLEPASKNLSIPSSCILSRTETHTATVLVVRDGRAKEITIQTGDDDGLRTEVLSGLDAKDQVIIPNGTVAEGTPVTPTEAAEPTSHGSRRQEDAGSSS